MKRASLRLIEDELRKRGIDDPRCYFAMRYWNPYTEEVLEEIKRDGINTLVIVPLYPQVGCWPSLAPPDAV
jgi:protoporphyrin/coproporphyrin ferrochelatase